MTESTIRIYGRSVELILISLRQLDCELGPGISSSAQLDLDLVYYAFAEA